MERRRDRGEEVPDDVKSDFFWALVRNGAGEIFQAVLNEEVLCSFLVIMARDGAYTQSSGSSSEGTKYGAAHFTQYEIARTLQAQARKVLYIGGTDQPTSGLAQFKSYFGARQVAVCSGEFYMGTKLQECLGKAYGGFRQALSLISVSRTR